MPIFQKSDERMGLKFWLPLSVVVGAGVTVVLLILGVIGGDDGIKDRYGVSGIQFLVVWNVLAISAGLIVGLLNPYIASPIAAVLVAILACYPASVLACAFTFGGRTEVGGLLLGALFLAVVMGALYGFLLYEPT